jgi:hypothetical protein
VAGAEHAWAVLHRRIRVFESRAAGDTGAELRRPIAPDDPALIDDDLADPHRNRTIPGGVRSWSKTDHLARMQASGYFVFTRDVLLDEPVGGGADRFVALMRSQGSYQGLRRRGLSDDDLGATEFELQARRAFDAASDRPGGAPPVSFSWRVRLGIRPG